jgi:hypothetical protein
LGVHSGWVDAVARVTEYTGVNDQCISKRRARTPVLVLEKQSARVIKTAPEIAHVVDAGVIKSLERGSGEAPGHLKVTIDSARRRMGAERESKQRQAMCNQATESSSRQGVWLLGGMSVSEGRRWRANTGRIQGGCWTRIKRGRG